MRNFLKNIKQARPWLYLSGLLSNLRECLLGSCHYLKLLLGKVPEKTVLLAEPNAFHGECLPGYVKYFRELGYKVVILCRYANYKEDKNRRDCLNNAVCFEGFHSAAK